MERELFIQSSVRIRNLEKKLLTKPQLERLGGAETIQDSFTYLKETAYAEELTKLDRIENFDIVFSSSLNSMYKTILEMASEKELVKILTYKYGFHNIKVALKEKILGEDFSDVYSELYQEIPDEVKKQIEEEKKESDIWYRNIAIQAYKLYQETGDPQKIEFFVDKQYFQKILETAQSFDLPLIEKYFRKMIDFTNLRSFIRCQKQGQNFEILKEAWIEGGSLCFEEISKYFYRDLQEFAEKYRNTEIGEGFLQSIKEYKKTGLLLHFEKQMDDELTNLLKKAKQITYGPEVLFAYIHAKEIEIKNLRITFVGKANGLSSDFIRERLRDTYV